jgi:hypothetical protein
MFEDFPMKKKWRRLLRGASFFLLLILFTANVIRAHTLGMERPPSMWLVLAIPPALSDLVFGNRDGYTSLKVVNDVFYGSVSMASINGAMIDRAILAVMALNPDTVSSRTELLENDDKGLVDLVKSSFRLFGYNATSPLYMYFVLLFLSAFIFALTFNTPFFHTVLASFLVAHYLFLPTVFYNIQLGSVVTPRFLPVLSMIACLHCILFATRPTLTVLELVALALQVGLLVFVIHMRSVTMWQVAVVGTTTLFALGGLTYRNDFRLTRRALQRFIPAIIPILFLMGGLTGLGAYRSVAYDQRYHREEQILTRVFWHSIFSGLAFNPVIAERYQLKADDVSITRAVGRITTDNGHASEWEAIGGASEGFSKLRWAPYDRLARDAFRDLCLYREPGQCVATLIYYKPLSLMHHLSWVYGFRHDVPDAAIFVSQDVGNYVERHLDSLKASLDRTGLRFRLWDPIAIFMVISFAVILFATGDSPRTTDVIAGIILTAGSTLPTLVGYPSMHTIAEPAIAIAASLYSSTAVVLGCGIDWQRAGRLLDRVKNYG